MELIQLVSKEITNLCKFSNFSKSFRFGPLVSMFSSTTKYDPKAKQSLTNKG